MAMGSAMGLIPILFPSWVLHGGADASSARALWLEIMAATQFGLGLGYLAKARVFPFVARLLATETAAEPGALALPRQRGISGR